jgi:hypothetical protein
MRSDELIADFVEISLCFVFSDDLTSAERLRKSRGRR